MGSGNRLRWRVVADDLTGAIDAAARFAMEGFSTAVALRGDVPDADAVVVDTNSRVLGESAAGQRVAEAFTRLRTAWDLCWYKKVDSAGRGHLAVEVEAAVAACADGTICVVCPAFPEMGRTVKGGHVLVAGRPSSQTSFGTAMRSPVLESHLPTVLLRQRFPVAAVAPKSDELRKAVAAGARVLVVDAVLPEDLDRVVEAGRELARPVLWVGSAGLAGAVARCYGPGQVRAVPDASPGRVLVVVGSQDPAARAQLSVLAANTNWPVIRRPGEAGRAGAGLIVNAPPGAGDPQAVAETLGRIAADAVSARAFDGLVLTGGDTARAVLDALECRALHVLTELADGVPLSVASGGRLDGVRVVTKAGSFGDDTTLLRAATYLSCGFDGRQQT